MSANEKFNSAMVFETQLDEAGMRSEKQKVDEILRKRMSLNPELGFNQTSSAAVDAEMMDDNDDHEAIDINDLIGEEENPSGANLEESKGAGGAKDTQTTTTLELDMVNKHECMKNIKRCLDKMQELFAETWRAEGSDSLPGFMRALLNDVQAPETHLNVKIFVLKLLVNNSQLFKPFARHWFHVICEFMIGQNTGGKGFHYFLRDLATLLIQWSEDFTPRFEIAEERKLCSQVVNNLVKLAADKSKYIFNINIEILATLMLKWRSAVSLDKTQLCKMLSVPDNKDGSHLWKMNAIQIAALASSFDVPVLTAEE